MAAARFSRNSPALEMPMIKCTVCGTEQYTAASYAWRGRCVGCDSPVAGGDREAEAVTLQGVALRRNPLGPPQQSDSPRARRPHA
jgi:hypothetical protein